MSQSRRLARSLSLESRLGGLLVSTTRYMKHLYTNYKSVLSESGLRVESARRAMSREECESGMGKEEIGVRSK